MDYKAPVRPAENPVLSPLADENKDEAEQDNDLTSILPGFLGNQQ